MVANEKLNKVVYLLDVDESAVRLAQKVRSEHVGQVSCVHFVCGGMLGHLEQKSDQVVQERVVVFGQFSAKQVLGHFDLVAHIKRLDGHHFIKDAIA